MKARSFFPLSILLFIISSSLPRLVQLGYAYGERKWYYILTALSLLFLGIAYPYYNKEDALHKRILMVLVCSMVSNLADELFFDPIHPGYNEILLVPITLLTVFLLPRKWIIKHHKLT